jgi:hypothetical protein
MNTEIFVCDDGCNNGQPIKRYAVNRATVDFPGQHSLAASRFGLAAHKAATCEYFGRAGFDVYTANGLSIGRHQWRREQYHKSNERECTIHSHLN